MRAAPQLTFETPERVQLSLDLAGVGSRALALLADLLLLFLCWVTVLLLWSLRGDLLSTVQGLTGALRLATTALFFASGWFYDLGFELWGGGRTPGKRLLGLRVVRADGAPVGLVESLARNLLRAVEIPFLYAPAVVTAAVTARHQRLGDLVAGTLVVRDRAYDLSRYGPPETAAGARFRFRGGSAARALPAADFERLVDFLRRRRELLPEPRRRIAEEAARALAARAGVPPPAPAEAEPFLEALASASVAEGG
ncbi:MAG: RDD family protein [Deltaproteobacteria bacterium]|nr:RDD family protein [Deltaproteobacteria bacterium]